MLASTPLALVGGGNGNNNPIIFGIIITAIVMFIAVGIGRSLRRRR
jgi:hypothetical protein